MTMSLEKKAKAAAPLGGKSPGQYLDELLARLSGKTFKERQRITGEWTEAMLQTRWKRATVWAMAALAKVILGDPRAR